MSLSVAKCFLDGRECGALQKEAYQNLAERHHLYEMLKLFL